MTKAKKAKKGKVSNPQKKIPRLEERSATHDYGKPVYGTPKTKFVKNKKAKQ